MSEAKPETVSRCFAQTAARHPARAFLNVLAETAGIYGIEAGEISYGAMAERAEARRLEFARQGYGPGHRVGLLVENRPDFFVFWLALNGLGISVVPINPDLRARELCYLIGHSEQVLTIAIASRVADIEEAGVQARARLKVMTPDAAVPPALTPAGREPVTSDTEAALLYTSGTTGMPKGCVLTNTYFLTCAHWYETVGGHCALGPDGERMLTPLPLFHMNAMACSAMGMIRVGGCLTVLDRFHPRTWWESVRASKASVVHYLGVMPSMLMGAAPHGSDRAHAVRFGFGAGVDRSLHAPFEARFGFPLIEAWAMTETGNGAVVAASRDPRHVGTNCFGKPAPEVECRIELDNGEAAGDGEPGELLVRRAGDTPRHGFFDRYLKDEASTAEAWRGGWFHTGDIVRRNPDGTLVFVDRKKNVIRRSGENIAAVEVEGALKRHDLVRDAAVCATPDPVRGDEVFACIVAERDLAAEEREEAARALVHWCLKQLAYYKAPGYVAFLSALPLTATNKVQRGEMKTLVARLIAEGDFVDTRALKRRTGG